MLDPFTALSLAGNIVQFLDFLWRLLSETREIHGSAEVSSADGIALHTITHDLLQLSGTLCGSGSSNPDETEKLAAQCRSVADELLGVLRKLRIDGNHTKWKSFGLALRSVWKKKEIDALVHRMGGLQTQMILRLQFIMSNQQSSASKLLQTLEDQNRGMETARIQQLQELKQETLDALDRVKSQDVLLETRMQQILTSIEESSPANVDFMTQFSKVMEDISAHLTRFSITSSAASSEQKVLRSLWFRTMSLRRAQIEPAYSKTFEWIFEDKVPQQSLTNNAPPNFLDWMESENGIYWIEGKAGSGKSTLMKFLIRHQKTKQALSSWAGPKKLVVASFFFWNSQDPMQNSQRGLFQSLLFEILRHCPELIPRVCASRWVATPDYQNQDQLEPWTLEELKKSMSLLAKHAEFGTRFCFFVDGLDEYGGDPSEIRGVRPEPERDHEELIRVLKDLTLSPNIKLCVSSRPWNKFKAAFGEDLSRTMILEQLTAGDIDRFVRERLEANSLLIKVKEKDNARGISSPYKKVKRGVSSPYDKLVLEIIASAHGVFLWVVLVVRSLIDGLQNEDEISDLNARLRDLPSTLEKYFEEMFRSIEDGYREKSAETFQIVLHSKRPLTLMTLVYLDEPDPDFALLAKIEPITFQEVKMKQEKMRTRLKARCAGLLEVTSSTGLYPEKMNLLDCRVDFIHRTVRDYLLTKDMQDEINSQIPQNFDPSVSLCKAFLAQMKTFPQWKKHLREDTRTAVYVDEHRHIFTNLLNCAREIEERTGTTPTLLLDEAGRVIKSRGRVWYEENDNPSLVFLQYCVSKRLQLYVREQLTKHPEYIPEFGGALFDFVLDRCRAPSWLFLESVDLLKCLVAQGLSLNQRFQRSHPNRTPWSRFLIFLEDVVRGTPFTRDSYLLTKMLIEHGADIKTTLRVRPSGTIRVTKSTRERSVEPENFLPGYFYKSAGEIIRDVFSAEEADYLINEARRLERLANPSLYDRLVSGLGSILPLSR